MQIVKKYFPELTEEQFTRFAALEELYREWNTKINVISRKDIDQLYERHVLHSLAIAKFIQFADHTRVLDVGTGGGFPGVPLAIFFPETEFFLVDSIGKKIKVVSEVANAIGLDNLTARHQRAEKVKGKFDFVVSRAVTSLPAFIPWVRKKFISESKNTLLNGIIALKGGDLSDELQIDYPNSSTAISTYFEEDFFQTKKIVYVQMTAK